MQANEVIQLLRHKRHDWMNELQLIQGYTSMGKKEKAQDIINNTIAIAEEEQRLMNLNIPYLTLWLLSFNWSHPNHRISYTVEMEPEDLSHRDLTLLAYSEETIRILESNSDPEKLYEGSMSILFDDKLEQVVLHMLFEGEYLNSDQLQNHLEQTGFINEISLREADHQHEVSMKLNVEIKR